jgi:hypothetical protein
VKGRVKLSEGMGNNGSFGFIGLFFSDWHRWYNFIDKHAITSLGLGTHPLPHSLQVNNVDGSINSEGSITQYCNLWICQGTKTVKLGFYVTNLGSDQLILGHPWFKFFSPSINWSINQLNGEDIIIETAGFHSRTPTQICTVDFSAPTDQIEVQKLIPEQYHQHCCVFSEEAAQCFPPS